MNVIVIDTRPACSSEFVSNIDGPLPCCLHEGHDEPHRFGAPWGGALNIEWETE